MAIKTQAVLVFSTSNIQLWIKISHVTFCFLIFILTFIPLLCNMWQLWDKLSSQGQVALSHNF